MFELVCHRDDGGGDDDGGGGGDGGAERTGDEWQERNEIRERRQDVRDREKWERGMSKQ